MKSPDEIFPIVDEIGTLIGQATRNECHGGSMLLHPVVHLHIINTEGALFLQKRSEYKDIQPNKWDTSIGGHVDLGESALEALRREAKEELGLSQFTPTLIAEYIFQSEIEREYVHSYACIYDGEIHIDPVEISDGRFWSRTEIEQSIGKELFTPNFELEYRQLAEQLFSLR